MTRPDGTPWIGEVGAEDPYPTSVKARSALFLLAIPRLAAQFDPVPNAYVGHMGGGERLVCCPCGGRPLVRRGELIACERARRWIPGVRRSCSRWFVATNRSILVFGGPR